MGFAVKRPMTSKLYKELGYSILMGAGVSYTYIHYYKRIYLRHVDELYDELKHRFANNPMLASMREDEQIIKNFGFSKWADRDDEDPDEEEAREMGLSEMGIFEGDANSDREATKKRLLEIFYG